MFKIALNYTEKYYCSYNTNAIERTKKKLITKLKPHINRKWSAFCNQRNAISIERNIISFTVK